MAITAVLWQFGFGLLCIILRFSERSCYRCLVRCGRCWKRCGHCLARCFCCCCRSRPSAEEEGRIAEPSRCAKLCQPVVWALSHIKLRWYWVMLANNVGFMVREFAVISLLDGWHMEVVVAHAAIWTTLLLVTYEVWLFSKDRPRGPKTIDQVLDMILLPLNYGIFCALCVRILKLQDSEENREMVTAVIDSADIWESWALWSVLELFVLVVENAAKRDPLRVNDQEYRTTIQAFKTLSLHGVKAFFLILVGFIATDIIVKGVIAPSVPTLCYWFYKDCMSCHEWYGLHINPVGQSVIYIMCTFALVFVFTFERMFSEYLHCIQPYWKFWGVKIVVSVTYFQWLVISNCFGMEPHEVYLWHTMLCCAEMPLLAILHATCAYPYGQNWQERLLDHVPTPALDAPPESEGDEDNLPPSRRVSRADRSSEARPSVCDEEQTDAEQPQMPDVEETAGRAVVDGPVDPESPGEEQLAPNLVMSVVESTPPRLSISAQEFQPRPCWSMLIYLLIWTGCCYGLTRLVFVALPPANDVKKAAPVYQITCNSQDLGNFVSQKDHWTLKANRTGPIKIPGTAGVWLPLCGSALIDCAIGYKGNPNVTCTAQGEYSWTGTCSQVQCGEPLKLPHAEAIYDHQNWISGMTVKYKCDHGYRGHPVATCGKQGNYTVQGSCQEILCPTPPPVPHSSLPPAPHGKDQKWKEGMSVQYQCDPTYHGHPLAICGEDEAWKLTGSCQVMCGIPPVIPHSEPHFNRSSMTDVAIGRKLVYKCNRGYGGHPVAVCGDLGKYSIEGSCDVVCGLPLEVPHGIARIDVNQAKKGFRVGATISYYCDPGYGGEPVATCEADGHWKLEKAEHCEYLGCGSLDDFLTKNISGSWKHTMFKKGTLNFTSSDYGDVVFFGCKPGYSGSPFVTCLHGKWSMTGRCDVSCGNPPQVAHALQSFDVNQVHRDGWLVGTKVHYKCEVGYGGEPVAACGKDGKWKFDGAVQCQDYGCGTLSKYLDNIDSAWQRKMEIAKMVNITSSDYGEVVYFNCKPGYGGKPLATCTGQDWKITDICKPFATSLGCKCAENWTVCKGWFGTKCERWHGCTGSDRGEPYGWCDVESGSCPSGASSWGRSPTWDYCSVASRTWVPEPVADEGLSGSTRVFLSVMLIAVLAGLGFYLHRAVQARRLEQALPPPNADAAESFTSPRGLSLPDLSADAAPVDES